MSRSYELLRLADRGKQLFQTMDPTPSRAYAKRHDLVGKGLPQEEVVLVQRLFLTPGESAPRVVAFCGVEDGDLSSNVCARAGEILAAQQAGKVCLVDANPYASSLGQHFGADGEPGFVDAIFRQNTAHTLAREMPTGNLWLLGIGSGDFRTHVNFTFDRLKNCVSDLRAEFGYVLIDAPPVNVYADILSIGKVADGVILVLKSNSTRREAALRAKTSLTAANIKLFGAVLTDRTFPIPDSIYRRI
jgi:MinD-like ATPase involved in chromosome partitioning or flagellar assembly